MASDELIVTQDQLAVKWAESDRFRQRLADSGGLGFYLRKLAYYLATPEQHGRKWSPRSQNDSLATISRRPQIALWTRQSARVFLLV